MPVQPSSLRSLLFHVPFSSETALVPWSKNTVYGNATTIAGWEGKLRERKITKGIALPLSFFDTWVGFGYKDGWGIKGRFWDIIPFLLPASRPFTADSGKQEKYTAEGAGGSVCVYARPLRMRCEKKSGRSRFTYLEDFFFLGAACLGAGFSSSFSGAR